MTSIRREGPKTRPNIRNKKSRCYLKQHLSGTFSRLDTSLKEKRRVLYRVLLACVGMRLAKLTQRHCSGRMTLLQSSSTVAAQRLPSRRVPRVLGRRYDILRRAPYGPSGIGIGRCSLCTIERILSADSPYVGILRHTVPAGRQGADLCGGVWQQLPGIPSGQPPHEN